MTSAQATCKFQWFAAPTINSSYQVQVTFNPDTSSGTDAEMDEFQVLVPISYNLPNTGTLSAIVPNGITIDGTFSLTADFSVVDDTTNTVISIINLQRAGYTPISYSFDMVLTTSPYELTWNVQDLTCQTLLASSVVETATGTNVEVQTGVSSQEFSMATASTSMTASTSSTETGATSQTLTITYTTQQPITSLSYFLLTIPKANADYGTGLNTGYSTSFITSSNQDSATVTIGGTSYTPTGATLTTGTQYTADTWAFTFVETTLHTTFTTAGQAIVITVPIDNPTLVTSLTADWLFTIKTAQAQTGTTLPDNYANVEISISPPISPGLVVSSILATTSGASASITSVTSISGTSASYQFTLTPVNPIPREGVLILTVPSGITVPSDDVSTFVFVCNAGCSTGSYALTYDSSTRELTITDAFTSFFAAAQTLTFTITGWTNAADTSTYSFTLASYYQDSSTSTLYGIETFTGFDVAATSSACYVLAANVTDGDTRIYGEPTGGYYFSLRCGAEIPTTYSLRVTFPDDYIVVQRSSCSFALVDSTESYATTTYLCTTNADNYVEISSWTSAAIPADTAVEFWVDSIINPGTLTDATGAITVATYDSSGSEDGTADYTFDQGYWTAGNVTTFTVTAQDSATNAYPVKYDFNVIPNGELPRYAYLRIDLPDDVYIISENEFEDSCGEDLFAFTNSVISCAVINSSKSILIRDGFLYEATTNFTDTDGLYFPPDLQFTLSGFTNPRAAGYSGAWDMTIYNEWDKTLYSWDDDTGPTIRVSGVAAPAYINPIFGDRVNGARDWIELLVTTTGGLAEGDKIIVRLPAGWQFTEDSKALGRSNNLADSMQVALSSADTRQLEFTVELALSLQRRLEDDIFLSRHLQTGFTIAAGYSFQFRITEMKNFYSLRPSTESIEYYVYNTENTLFEEQIAGMTMVNQILGTIDSKKNGIIPKDFRTDFEAAYTLTVSFDNFEQNMIFTVLLPPEVDFGTDDAFCTGLSGVQDTVLKCATDRTEKSITFTNAMLYAQANPGQLEILIENLKNPVENKITSSFGLRTKTFDNYGMDELYEGLTINFYCEYPCASCPEGSPSVCDSCYQTAVERYFYQQKCLGECPEKMVETAELTCTDCIEPCLTCEGTPNSCQTCIDGYYIVNGDQCREVVIWYFPFVGTAILFFLLISISEIVTKRKSNFRESLIALWSLPEVGSWGTVIWFMYDRIGQSEATILAAVAALMYICFNLVHSCYLGRYMAPAALPSYTEVRKNYPCGTRFAYMISFLFSFKFSLILVSYLFNIRRLKGDYSAKNWKQFNVFSLGFCLMPFAIMMFACSYFLYTDGLWSLPGFVCAEVIFLSTIMQLLVLIDAITAIKCKTVGKRKVLVNTNIATGADYESDEDERNLKTKVIRAERVTRGKKGDDVFGVDESEMDDSSMGLKSKKSYRSQLSHQTQIMNEEARKQIAMLEELAHQMREEKRQLQMDKDRIEQEKNQLNDERVRSHHHYEGYLEDYQRQQQVLNAQVREMERQKIDLVQQVEDRLEEGNRANIILAKKVQDAQTAKAPVKKDFRDFEGEMEDYEPVSEKNSEEEQDEELDEEQDEEQDEEPTEIMIDAPQLPIEDSTPFGQADDFYRTVEGDSQQWMQQITPRAGGITMFGDEMEGLEMSDAGVKSAYGIHEIAMEKNATAHFEVTSVPPSRFTNEIEHGRDSDAEYQDINSQVEIAQSEMYHQRSDAEHEMESEVQEVEANPSEFFEAEQAVFSQLGDQIDKVSEAEFFTNDAGPVFGQVKPPPSRHGQQEQYFAPEPPQAGEGDNNSDKMGSTMHYFNQEPANYEVDDQKISQYGTQQQFFNAERAMAGEPDDAKRSQLATPEAYMNRTMNHFGKDVYQREDLEGSEHQMMIKENALKDDASNIGRSVAGSEMIYQEREPAYIGQDAGNRPTQTASEEFLNREGALYSQENSVAGKLATPTRFFKHDEAVRGDADSQDHSVAATQQDFFVNVDKQELGRETNYSRRMSGVSQDFINKSELGGREQGAITANNAADGESIEYMDKSEAEYGRSSSRIGMTATQQKFFNNDQNPEFGKGEQYTRDADASQEEFFEQPTNPAFGRGDKFTRGAEANQERFFEPEQQPMFGKPEDYSRGAEAEQEYIPEPEEDESGLSESSEGDIANHQPFNSNMIPVSRNQGATNSKSGQGLNGLAHAAPRDSVEQVRRVLAGNPNAKQFEEDQKELQRDVPQAAVMASPQKNRFALPQNKPMHTTHTSSITPDPQRMQPGQMSTSMNPMPHMQGSPLTGQQAKTILYSDKSETSVEDLMDDTPSNYNIANGRFEGKSLGLKAMLLHAKSYQNQTLDPDSHSSQPVMHTLATLNEPQQNRSPPNMRNGNSLIAPGMSGAQKGIIGSQNDERQFVNNLYQSQQSSMPSIGDQSSINQWRAGGPIDGNRVQHIVEESSANGSAYQPRNTRSQVRTNKQFVEEQKNAASSSRISNASQYGKGRGAPKVTKNNFTGASK